MIKNFLISLTINVFFDNIFGQQRGVFVNLYEKQFRKIEKKSCIKEEFQKTALDFKLFVDCYNNHFFDKLSVNEFFFENIIYNLCDMSDEAILWIRKILKDLNTSYLLKQFLIELTFLKDKTNKEQMDKIMKSIVMAGLVKDIEYDEKNDQYKFTSNKGKTYKITRAFDDEEEALEFNGKCHSSTEIMLREAVNSNIDAYGSCVLYYDLFYNPHYHSYIVNENNIIIDYAHNMIVNQDLYVDEFGYDVLFVDEASKIIDEIDNLELNDKDFAESKIDSYLKYALKKHANKKEDDVCE